MADHARSDDPAVQAQLDRFAQLSPGRDVLGLERIAALLASLGDPHLALPPVFHVAGTNGKGSTCAFLRAGLEAAGLRVHVYTSPHLVRFNERIRLAGTLIGDAQLAPLLAGVLNAAEARGLAPSFFEATTAAAFLAFSRAQADACVVEVGLGGRLDATNVVQPVVCGIASLGLDHESFLLAPDVDVPEAPLARIAFEKAGIAKRGVPLVTQQYNESQNAAIAAQAQRAGAPLHVHGTDWESSIDGDCLTYRDGRGELRLPLPHMVGRHQASNAALAVAMLRQQRAVAVPHGALEQAMATADWPARLQRLTTGPLVDLLLPKTPLWLDGGHNADAGAALARHFGVGERDLHLVIGMLANKHADALLTPLGDRLASITVVPIPGHEHHPVAAFAGITEIAPRPAASLKAALAALHPAPGDSVLIAGSLYLAGEALRINRALPR